MPYIVLSSLVQGVVEDFLIRPYPSMLGSGHSGILGYKTADALVMLGLLYGEGAKALRERIRLFCF